MMVSITIILTYMVISANLVIESTKNKKMTERKITPRFVEVTPEEAKGLFETSNEEAAAARSRLMARFALQTAENVPVIGVIMGDQAGKKVPARMIDLSLGDLGTTLNANKHVLPHPQQVEAKKADIVDDADTLPPVVESQEAAPLWPDEDLDVTSSPTDTPQESDATVEPSPVVVERQDTLSNPGVIEDAPASPVAISPLESVKEDDPLAQTKELTKAIVEYHPQAYLHNRETLVHVLSGRYGEELRDLPDTDASEGNRRDIYESTLREAREIKSEVGRLEEASRKTGDLLDTVDKDLKRKAESYATFETDAQQAIGAYSELAKGLVATADDTETLVNNLRVGRPMNRANLQETYDDIFTRLRTLDYYYDQLSSRADSLQEAAATQLTSFQGSYEGLDDGAGEVYRMRDAEGDLSDASLSVDQVADRVISLGNPSSVNALRGAVDDKIDDQVRAIKKKQNKIEDFVHTLAGVKNEADSLDMTALPDRQELRTMTQRLLTALDEYKLNLSARNSEDLKQEVIRLGALLKNNVLDDLTIARVRRAAGSNADFEQRLVAARIALNELGS